MVVFPLRCQASKYGPWKQLRKYHIHNILTLKKDRSTFVGKIFMRNEEKKKNRKPSGS